MARRARMLALLQLSSLVFLLVVELTHAAPVSDGINTIRDGDEVFSEKRDDLVHTIAPSEDKPGDSVAESEHHAATAQDINSVSTEDSEVTKAVDYTTSIENVEKDVGSTSAKSEDKASEQVSEENADKNKDSLSIKSDDGSSAESEANMLKHEDSPVTNSGENGKATESSNADFEENTGKHEEHTSVENEEVTSVREANDTVSEERVGKNEEPKTEENTSDVELKGNVEKADSSIISTIGKDASTPEDSEEGLEENMDKYKVEATDGEPSKEQIGTAVAENKSNEDSEEFVVTSKVEKDEVESSSSDKEHEENKEDETAEDTPLNKDDTSEDEDSEESNKEMEAEHGVTMENSSEETSDTESEAGDIEVNENHSSSHEESHVTNSPFSRLSLPSSDNQHIETSDNQHREKDEQHNDKDAAMEEHESNPSVEEIAENEAGSPDELIENDKVDSEVINSDNKTAALGRNMPITKAEEDAQNKDQYTNEDSKTTVVLGGKLLEEAENERDNFLGNDDMDSKEHLDHSAEENEGGFVAAEESSNIAHSIENPSEDEGSGVRPDVDGFASHGDNDHKDMPETSSQEKHEDEINDKKEGNKDEDAAVSEKEDTKLSEESGHHTDVFADSGSGYGEEEHNPFGKQANNRTDDVDDGAGLLGHNDDMASGEHTTESNAYSAVSHVPIFGDNEESSAEYFSETPASENESSTKIAAFEQTNDQNESGDYFKEENLAQNNTNVQVMSLNPTPVLDESDNHHVTFDGSGDGDTTTSVTIIVPADIIDDGMTVSSMEMDLVNSSVIGEASPAYQEKPAEKVISPQLAGAPPPPTTEPPCIEDEDNDCLLHSNKNHENAEVSNILEDDDEVPPEPTKGGIHTKPTSNDDLKELETVISTTPAVKMSSEEESLQRSISVDLNQPILHSNEEISVTTLAPEVQEITEPTVDHETVDSETINISAPDTIVEHPLDKTGTKEMSGKMKAVNVNELGLSGKENSDDLGEPDALDSSSASGSYVVLGCIMAVVVVLLAYAAIKSRRERGTNTNSKKQSDVAGDDDDGTELKDMKKALLPPETPHDDCNGDIEANRKPLMDKDENQEDEEKEPIIKQNGTLELSEPPRDVESQVDSSTAAPAPSKPQQRNGLSEVVVEKPAIRNGKADSIITHPVAAKVKVIENEDSIAKTPVIINRGGNSPPH